MLLGTESTGGFRFFGFKVQRPDVSFDGGCEAGSQRVLTQPDTSSFVCAFSTVVLRQGFVCFGARVCKGRTLQMQDCVGQPDTVHPKITGL